MRLCTDLTAHRGSTGIALLFLDHGTRRGEGSASRPGRSLPPGKTRYTLYRRLGGAQGRSGQVRKILPLPGFDPRNVQPVASRYIDWATRPTQWVFITKYFSGNQIRKYEMGRVCGTYGEGRRAYRALMGRTEENRLPDRSRRRWNDNIKRPLGTVGRFHSL